MRAALYARVSTERQERHQTIDSQLAALRAWAGASGHALAEEHVFRDEGYSGSRLDRPGLDALRDAVRDGAVGIVAVLTPDRLARRYAYQVLLLEEFRRAGCEVAFLQHPISDDPNDQLLLQIQGAIAEYERAVLGERFRRGKLQKARDGHYQGGCAPYGYRYVPRQEAVPGHLVVNEPEAELVRILYGWLIEEQTTIRQILKRLNASPYFPRSGHRPWSASLVHHVLADPVYAGTAYANRYSFVPAKKPRSARGPRTGEATCRQLKPREQWIAIPVPAIVDAETWARAQAQLARNAALSFRNNTKYNYLLRCLLTCRVCGLAMFGRTHAPTATQPERRSYQCHGKDCILSARPAACPSRVAKAEEIEAAVWGHVAGLPASPERLVAQFERFAAAAEAGTVHDRAADQQLRSRLDRVARADKRLLDAYQAGAVSLAELSERRRHLAEEQQNLERQQQERDRLRQQRLRAEAVRTSLEAFCARVRGRLDEATLAEKQAILQLVIERITVGDGHLEIRHVIPLRPPQPGSDSPVQPASPLRTDRVHPAPLVPGRREDRLQRLPEAKGAVAGGQFRRGGQAAGLEVDQQLAPALGALADADLKAEQLLLALRGGADQHQHALGLRLHPGLEVNAVCPDIDVMARREVAPLPAGILGLPLVAQPGDDRGREVRGALAQRGGERLPEVAHGEAAQVEDRQHSIQASRPSRPAGEDRRCEADALGLLCVGAAVAQLDLAHRDRTDPGLHQPLRPVPVPHDPFAPVRHSQALHRGQERLGLRLDRLRQQSPGAAPQDRRQRIVDLFRLTKGNNGAIAVHRRIAPPGGSGRLSPASIRRLSHPAITQFRP
jgi:site-specific DNA recombinase